MTSRYRKVVAEIRAAPDTGLWPALKDFLRITEEMLLIHARRSPCWRARQRRRIIRMYHTAVRKSAL